jgi:hypothetical protein
LHYEYPYEGSQRRLGVHDPNENEAKKKGIRSHYHAKLVERGRFVKTHGGEKEKKNVTGSVGEEEKCCFIV